MSEKYPHLFTPLQIGPYTLKNRIVGSAMSAGFLDVEGKMTEKTYAFFEAIAKGGAAMITVGNTLVHDATGNNHGRCLRLDQPATITSLINLSDIVKRYGALASIQLLHAGRRADPQFTQGGKVYGPSAGVCHYGSTTHEVTELDEETIDLIVNAFGDAAELAMLGGFQMCQVHGGHGWLINQFLSPANNQRTDRFGGSIANRTRFAIMVVENIRKKCGPNFPIEFRISGDDFMAGGATIEDTVEVAKLLDGLVDSFQVSATSFHNPRAFLRMFPNMFLPRGCNAYLAEEIKKHVQSPVITVGGFNDPAQMEQLLADGKADVIALGRSLTVDPALVEKLRTGREDDIIYCLRCGLCSSADFVPYVKYPLGVNRCAVNPWYNWPEQYLRRAWNPKHSRQTVLVAGGGPGGMEAALGAAENGNRVILCEQSDRLGGLLQAAWQPPFKRDIERFVKVISRRVQAEPLIELRLQTTVTPELIQEIRPDQLILAIGAKPIIPNLPGIDDPRVILGVDLHQPGLKIGEKVVMLGGGLVGCEEAIHLAMQGKEVTIVEQQARCATGAPELSWWAVEEQLAQMDNVQRAENRRVTAIDAAGVVAVDPQGNEYHYPADTIILAVGLRAEQDQLAALRAAAGRANVVLVGDCYQPANLHEAVYQGFFAGYSIR